MSRIKLKKSEYPKYIKCLVTNCLTMCRFSKEYANCPAFEWKKNNMEKYDITMKNGQINTVYEIKE